MPRQASQSVVNDMSASPSGPNSPSLGVTEVPMPSLFQFSAVDAASAVDYSKDSGFEDGVVDSPPAKVAKLNYAPSPSPSPLRNEKHVRNPRSTRRLCMNEPNIDVPTFTNAPLVLVSTPSMSRKLNPPHPRSRCPSIGLLKFLLDHLRVLVSFNFLGFSDFHP